MTDTVPQARQRLTTITIFAYSIVEGPATYSVEDMDRLYTAIDHSELQGQPPNRFGFLRMHRFSDSILYGFFVHEFERELHGIDESKTEITLDAGDLAKYLVILDLSNNRLLLQRRHRPYPTLPEWPTIFDRIQVQLRYLFARAVLTPPRMFVPLTVGETREEFLEAFFDPRNIVKHVVLEDFQLELIPDDFRFFNPRDDLNASPFKEGLAESIPQMRRAALEATRQGDLQHAPVVRGLIEAARNPLQLRFERRETKTTTTLQAQKEVKTETTITYEGDDPGTIRTILEQLERPASQGRPLQRTADAALPAPDDNQMPMFGAGGS